VDPLVGPRPLVRLCAGLQGALRGVRSRLPPRQHALVRAAAQHLCVLPLSISSCRLERPTLTRSPRRRLQAPLVARAALGRRVGAASALAPHVGRLLGLLAPALLPRRAGRRVRPEPAAAKDGQEVVEPEPRAWVGRRAGSLTSVGRQGARRHDGQEGVRVARPASFPSLAHLPLPPPCTPRLFVSPLLFRRHSFTCLHSSPCA